MRAQLDKGAVGTVGFRLVIATVAASALFTPPAKAADYLWIERTLTPGYFHQAWFIKNGGLAANIHLDGAGTGTGLHTVMLDHMADGDTLYSVAHGVEARCVVGGPKHSGGHIHLQGMIDEGFRWGAPPPKGTDPGNVCGPLVGEWAPYPLPTRNDIHWYMMTCYGATPGGWAGGLSVVQSAQNRLPTATIWGANSNIYFNLGWRVGGNGTLAQKQACVNTFAAWVQANTSRALVVDWYDNTPVASHSVNLQALNDVPVAAYNDANGTTISLTENLYIYSPPIPGMQPRPPAREDEEDVYLDEGAFICEDGVVSVPTVSEWGLIALAVLLLAGTAIKFGRRRRATRA